MARHRRMLAPINTVKHYVHRTNVSIASGAVNANTLVDAVVAPATANAFEVKEGAVVKAVHLEYWVIGSGTTGNTSQFMGILEKVPVNSASVTSAQILNLGAYPNKKNILYSTQGVIGQAVDGQAGVPIIRDWALIPKGKQRFGQTDRLVWTVGAIGASVNLCGLTTFKEYI